MKRITWGVPSFWIERLPLYVGLEHGFFEEADVALQVEYLHGGAELAAAVREGRILIGEMGLPPFLTAFAEGLPAHVIGSSTVRRLDHYLVARLDIGSLAELRGKRIGILAAGSCDDTFICEILRRAGVDPLKEVERVPLGKRYGDLRCITAGEVAAGFMVEPWVTQGESEGSCRILTRVGDWFPRYQWGIVFAHQCYRQERPEEVIRLMQAFRKACRRIRTDPEGVVPLGARLFKVTEEVFSRALMHGMPNWEIDARIDVEGVRNAIQIQWETGALSRPIEQETLVVDLV